MTTYPHCDSRVLHAPGTCKYCILSPGLIIDRIRTKTNFTNTDIEGWAPCPAVEARGIESINAWPGNTTEGYTTFTDEEAREFWGVDDWYDGEEGIPCDSPPKGWYCKGNKGHDGPCPAYPKGWRRIYWMIKLRSWEM